MLFALAIGGKRQREKYFKGLEIRTRDVLRAGELLLDRGWGRTFIPDEDDTPFIPVQGDRGPTLIFNLPRPPAEMQGRETVIDAVRVETTR